MNLKLQIAASEDVPELVRLRNAASEDLVARYGKGFWSGSITEKGVLFAMRMSSVYVARKGRRVIATLALSTRKPWAIDKKFFSASKRPLYLTSMAVDPALQRQGLGRLCIEEARRIATEWPADSIRLDAFDAAAGAGDFYAKCGFREVGRVSYRAVPLIYFEKNW